MRVACGPGSNSSLLQEVSAVVHGLYPGFPYHTELPFLFVTGRGTFLLPVQ